MVAPTMSDILGFSPDTFWDNFHRTQQRHAELDHERQLALIRMQTHALVWTGTADELTATITHWYESGWIVAINLQDALQKAGYHFLAPDGTAVVKHSPLIAPPQETEAQNPREAFVIPLLERRGWSILDWANEANVSPATAQDYLAGKTKPYRNTRVKLAKGLGVSVQQLPR